MHELNPLLWRVARSQGAAPDEAMDVVQTAWLELLRSLEELRNPKALVGWLVAVTRREAWRRATAARRTNVTDSFEDRSDDAPGAVELLIDSERDQTLWHYFEQLSERCRQLLRVLTAVDRPDYDEVSVAMGMPRGSIGPTRARCLAKLRDLLSGDALWSAS